MPDTRKPSRPSRDPRLDSTPPAALGEVPLGPMPAAATLPPAGGRVASLQAEVERLRAERETDADETAEMLVQIAESDRMRAAAQSQATVAGERVGALESDLDEARVRIDALEAEVVGLREQWSVSESRLRAARDAISSALTLLEEMERREEMGASMRARAMRDTLHALGREAQGVAERDAKAAPSEEPSAGPESSVEIVGTHDLEWDFDLAEPE
jgi:septal ring factor EnvC (AmiA/AmiB activator)